MKKLIVILSFIGMITGISAQEATVENSITGVQTGLLGLWVNNETRLSKQIALRTEVGLDAEIIGGAYIDGLTYDTGTSFYISPVITAEPRWYFNLDKRTRKGKSILNNSGNFLGLKMSYHPDWFVISNRENAKIADQINIIPKWGIKRSIGQHFNYEAGIGLGIRHIFLKQYGYAEDQDEAALDLHLRVGYTF